MTKVLSLLTDTVCSSISYQYLLIIIYPGLSMFFKNFKIRTKLTIAFTTFVMLIMLGSGFALMGLNSANQDIHDVVDDIYPATVKPIY